jgi:cytochrome b
MPTAALGPTQPHIQWLLGHLSLGLKQPECEANHCPASNAMVKNVWSDMSSYQMSAWCHTLLSTKDNFITFHFKITDGSKQTLNCIMKYIHQIKVAFNFLKYAILISYCHSQTFNLSHFQRIY